MAKRIFRMIAVIGLGIMVSSPIMADTSSSDQAAIAKVQAQIKTVQASISPAIAAQAKVTQSQFETLQKNVQAQLSKLQKQLQDAVNNLEKQIQQAAAANGAKVTSTK